MNSVAHQNYADARDALDDMRALGVEVVRLSPQSPQDVLARLQPLMPAADCHGYWHGLPGLEQLGSAAAESACA